MLGHNKKKLPEAKKTIFQYGRAQKALDSKSMVFFISILLIYTLFTGCTAKKLPVQSNDGNSDANDFNSGILPDYGGGLMAKNIEKISFRTEDGFAIRADFLKGGKNAVVLLHQFNSDRHSYDNLAKKLNDNNFTVIALDLRGHGESLDQNGIKRPHSGFTEKDFVAMTNDLKAAKRYLELQDFTLYAAIGSSIGANTCARYAAIDQSIEKIVLLSPGLNFKGIETEGPALDVKARTLIVASDDDQYSYSSGKTLQGLIPNSEFVAMHNAGHGTNMFAGTNLENEIVEWIKK